MHRSMVQALQDAPFCSSTRGIVLAYLVNETGEGLMRPGEIELAQVWPLHQVISTQISIKIKANQNHLFPSTDIRVHKYTYVMNSKNAFILKSQLEGLL